MDESAAGAAKLNDDFPSWTDDRTLAFCNEQPFRRVIQSNWRNQFLKMYREDVFLADELNPPYEEAEYSGPDESSFTDETPSMSEPAPSLTKAEKIQILLDLQKQIQGKYPGICIMIGQP